MKKPACVLLLLLVTSCSGTSTKAADPGTTSPPTPTSTQAAPSAVATTAPPASPASSGCAPVGRGVPAGVTSGSVIDVDGDGKRDTGWVIKDTRGDATVGITTSSGATFSTPFGSASPVERTLFVADVTGTGTDIALLDDGRGAQLYRITGCALKQVLNPQGQPYTFSFGFTDFGTGVGCSRIGGQGQTLVGLKLNQDSKGNPVSIKRTQVVIDGTRAHNGLSDVIPETDRNSAAARSATTVSCGDLTAANEGISLEG